MKRRQILAFAITAAVASLLASCGNDGVIKVWDVKGGKEVKSLMVELPKKVVKAEEKKPATQDEAVKNTSHIKSLPNIATCKHAGTVTKGASTSH